MSASLPSQSLVDSAGEAAINNKTAAVAAAVKAGKMAESTKLWAEAEKVTETVTNGVNFYNILKTSDNGSASYNHVMATATRGEDHYFKSPELGKLLPFKMWSRKLCEDFQNSSSVSVTKISDRIMAAVHLLLFCSLFQLSFTLVTIVIFSSFKYNLVLTLFFLN